MVVALNLAVPADAEVVVELDLFSGRPNPAWRLTGAAREQLLRELRRVPSERKTSVIEPGLGYRGFVVRIGSAEGTTRIQIGHGTVEVDGSCGRDDGYRIEKFLTESMPPDVKARFGSLLPQLP
jgi:hypothetical protein